MHRLGYVTQKAIHSSEYHPVPRNATQLNFKCWFVRMRLLRTIRYSRKMLAFVLAVDMGVREFFHRTVAIAPISDLLVEVVTADPANVQQVTYGLDVSYLERVSHQEQVTQTNHINTTENSILHSVPRTTNRSAIFNFVTQHFDCPIDIHLKTGWNFSLCFCRVIAVQRGKQQFIFLTQEKSRFAWLHPFAIRPVARLQP